MITLPKIDNLDVEGKRVLVRADLDLGEKIEEGDEVKLKTIIPTLSYLIEKKSKLILIGHRGRPEFEGDKVRDREKLTLGNVAPLLSKLMQKNVNFVDEIVGMQVKEEVNKLGAGEILMLENLRYDAREEQNDEGFAKELAELADVYVNEAFSVCHREHASIVGIPKLLPHAAGLRLTKEIEALNIILEQPKTPVVSVISGVKEDKLTYIEGFAKFSDKILIGGRLPEFIENILGGSHSDFISESILKQVQDNNKAVVGQLIADKEDITIHSIERFEKEIAGARTIVVAGPVGKFEDEGHRLGTTRVYTAVVNNTGAFKLAGGGDTEKALQVLGLGGKFDWVSVGGGAMLEFLARGTLPGLEALVN